MTNELVREVDDEMRQERMQQLWRRYRGVLAVGVMLLVVAVVGVQWWQGQQRAHAQQAMRQLGEGIALMKEQPAKAAGVFAALAKTSTGERHDMARLWLARADLASGKPEQAQRIFTDLAEHPQSTALLWRDLACLELKPMPAACAARDDSPLHAARLEVQAAQWLKAGETDKARTLLETLRDEAALPISQHARILQSLASLPEAP